MGYRLRSTKFCEKCIHEMKLIQFVALQFVASDLKRVLHHTVVLKLDLSETKYGVIQICKYF